jgi:hypothetical protein
LYQAALYLAPPAFRREFSGEILRVFDEARLEACAAGANAGLWVFRARMVVDLVRAMGGQWLRTGWPWIAAASIMSPLVMASAVASVWQRIPLVLPRDGNVDDQTLLAMLAAVVLLIVAATIILTLWFTRPLLYRRRR